MTLSLAQRELLMAMREGASLKIHRDLDGDKQHILHPLEGDPGAVDAALVEALRNLEMIQSNLKFPAATYVLTHKALQALSA